MKNIIMALFFLVIFTSNAATLRKADDCSIEEPDNSLDREKIYNINLKTENLYIDCRLYSSTFVDEYALYAVPWITNLSEKKIDLSYHIAFFDKNNDLVATISQKYKIPKDANGFQLGSCIARLPKKYIEQIASYKLVIYTDSKS